MENLTYEAYLADPAIRDHLERQARRERAAAMHALVFAPLMRAIKQAMKRPAPQAPRTMQAA